MKFKAGKTYRTSGGEEAFIYCVDAPGALPIHGRIGTELFSWTESGLVVSAETHYLDLIAPEQERISQKVWVNIYKDSPLFCHLTERMAIKMVSSDCDRVAVPCLLTEIVSPE